MNPVLTRSFRIANTATLIAWLPLFFAPAWVLQNLAWWVGYVAVLCATYAYFLLLGKTHDAPGQAPRGNFNSLEGVLGLFRSPRGVLVGWLHYLAFDLMVGLYIVQDSQALGVNQWLVLPVLFFTLMFGPAGLLAYWGLRIAVG